MSAPLRHLELETLRADVLVVGGGFAGCFAAVKAAEAGADVIMVVKGRAGRSGLTPWANSWFVFENTRGVSREDYLRQFVMSGEYLNNMDFVALLMAESYERYLDVSAWGARTGRSHYYQPGTVTRSIEVVDAGDAMRQKAVSCGVRLLERVMVTTLLRPDGRVAGAAGFHLESGRPYAVVAGATVLCAGPASFKPLGMGYPCSAATADGDAMAYRAGAEISGKEFNDGHPARPANPLGETATSEVPSTSPLVLGGGPPSADGPVPRLDATRLGMRTLSAVGVHDGGQPIDPKYIFSPGSAAGGRGGEPSGPFAAAPGYSTPGMSNHKAEGVFPQDLDGASNVPGLWAAGDGLSSMQNGAGYAGFGCSCAGSAVQGARAGRAAAEHVAAASSLTVPDGALRDAAAELLDPLTRARGYSPAWITRLLQGAMLPYFVMYVKERRRMELALTQIEYLQEKFAPELKARDPHELRLAHEARNMLLNAEMKLRAGLAREESRGTHYREDFPFRDDERFLCWIKLVEKDGGMTAVRHPVPSAWHPDSALPYRETYPVEFPGEEARLGETA
jgi:succinate dehydrogenase/fumarate reductase flavoprotein subunit